MQSVELLAPVKNLEYGRAAILCGADALYVGAPQFGARYSAGVSVKDIEELCTFAHLFGAKVYVAMNTLLFEDELSDAEKIATCIYNAGADALIVQDMSFLRMQNLPPIELHASTQTFNMCAEKVRFLSETGFSRVILERALSAKEIEEIHKAVPGTELEAFIHGAICVSYSGRCYMSRTMSQRSGNRGMCLQSCRLPYNLLNEQMQPIVKDKHLLSVRDMNLSDNLEDLINAGVCSFKIEGRLKDLDYVKNIVSWYRDRLDTIINSRNDLCRSSKGRSAIEFTPTPGKSFSRGATPYFIKDTKNRVSSFDTPKSSGEYIGRIKSAGRDFFILADTPSQANLANGDGICFYNNENKFTGTNINKVEGSRIYPNRMDGLRFGTEIYRNYDHLFVNTVERSRMKRTIDIKSEIDISADKATLHLFDADTHDTASNNGLRVSVSQTGDFSAAKNPERAEDTIRTQIAKTGDTIYCIKDIKIKWDKIRFLPVSILNELRREAADKLTGLITSSYTRRTRKEENKSFPYPVTAVSGEENITNSLAEKFYRDHGVTDIEKGYDVQSDLTGKKVMQMRYCLRRELGECLKENPRYKGKLYIENGLNVYELCFDCKNCTTSLIYKGKRDKKPSR